MTDACTDNSGQRDGDHESPRSGEESEAETELALDGQHDQENRYPDAPRYVARAPGERGLRRAEPYGVDPVDLVIGAYPQSWIT